MLDTTHITHATACHAGWKHRLREAIRTGRSDWDVAATQLDDQCELGQWLHSLAPEDRATAHWKAAVERHHAFHQAAAGVLALALAGRRKEAEEAMVPGSEFAEVSKRLTLEMAAWQKDLAEPVLFA